MREWLVNDVSIDSVKIKMLPWVCLNKAKTNLFNLQEWAFRSSHRRCSIKKGFLRISQTKNKLWNRCFPVNFAKFLRTPFV